MFCFLEKPSTYALDLLTNVCPQVTTIRCRNTTFVKKQSQRGHENSLFVIEYYKLNNKKC